LCQQSFESLKESSDLQAALSLTSQLQYQQLYILCYKDSRSNTNNSKKEKKNTTPKTHCEKQHQNPNHICIQDTNTLKKQKTEPNKEHKLSLLQKY
jgi:hypothetical protein